MPRNILLNRKIYKWSFIHNPYSHCTNISNAFVKAWEHNLHSNIPTWSFMATQSQQMAFFIGIWYCILLLISMTSIHYGPTDQNSALIQVMGWCQRDGKINSTSIQYVQYDMIWYDITWYDMAWYDTIWCNMIWYNTIYAMLSYAMLCHDIAIAEQ